MGEMRARRRARSFDLFYVPSAHALQRGAHALSVDGVLSVACSIMVVTGRPGICHELHRKRPRSLTYKPDHQKCFHAISVTLPLACLYTSLRRAPGP